MLLVVEHHEALEVDLLKQDVDLLDFWRGELSPRRLALLIEHLPHDSLFVQAVSPDLSQVTAWGHQEHLLADLYDLTLAVNTSREAWPPKWHPRPADEIRRRQREQSRADALERQRARIQAIEAG